MTGWIKTRDELPMVGQSVLYYFAPIGGHSGVYCGLTTKGPLWASGHGFLYGDVTHWMPMPPPPAEYADQADSGGGGLHVENKEIS
jgi:hypothetical protein